MQNPVRTQTEPHRFGLRIVALAALIYCVWLGAHWLPLDWADKELSASAARVWDVKRELTQGHGLPWWTPYYMSGSSYALNYSRGFYLLPWLLFSTFANLQAAGKLMALSAILASAVTMYFCARHFLRHEWAAVLAALAYMFHPEQLTRAATQEHMTIILFFPFAPLLWLTFARALESGRFRDVFWCALTATAAMLADNKQAFIQFMFLFFYLLFWLWQPEWGQQPRTAFIAAVLGFKVAVLCPERRQKWRTTLRTCLALAALTALLAVASIVPAALEARHVKLFLGDPLETWQRTYSLKSPLALVDRYAVLTRNTVQSVLQRAQSGGYQVHSETEATVLRQEIQRVLSLQMDSPEKYAGIVLLALIACAVLCNARRENRRFFWFCVGMLLASVALAAGLDNVWMTTWNVFKVLFGLDGVPGTMRLAVMLIIAVGFAALILFAKRKLTTRRKWIFAGVVLTVFLFLPSFRILAVLPYFKEIRAPYVFYDLPAVFTEAMLAGFFATDVLEAGRWRAHLPKIVGMLAVLLLLDYWPYQKPTMDNGVSERTLKNLEATYSSFRKDPDWVKTYSVSGRYFHLLGPMYGGKPQVYEAFYNWMCPLGTGLLNQQAFSSWDNHLAFLDLINARYVVFDKSDPGNSGNTQLIALYRKTFPIALENDDFAVFRNATAHAYVMAYARACLFVGDIRESAPLALALSARGWPLVHSAGKQVGAFEKVYHEGSDTSPPPITQTPVTLSEIQLTRENNESVRIKATAPTACLAVIAESYFPFWRAEVDGKHAEVLRVSCGLMGLELPAGSHEIVLRYEPPRVYSVAGCVSALAFFACFGIMIWDTHHSSTTRSSVASLRPS